MESRERIKLIDRLNEFELAFPVEEWRIDDIHVWPLLKEQIFFSVYNNTSKESISKNENKFSQRNIRSFFKKYFNLIKSSYSVIFLNLKKSKISFSGASSHRVLYEGYFINRYFYPLMKYLETNNVEYNSFEYKFHSNNKIDSHLIFKLLPFFVKPIKTYGTLFSDKTFLNFLDVISQEFGFNKEDFKKIIIKKINVVNSWANLYEFIFKKANSKYSFGLCYYSAPMFGMNLAAHRRGVIAIDVQHGTQGPLHFAYTYKKVPKGGFNTMPNEFWCWDKESYGHLTSWTNGDFKVRISGNPWIQFINEDIKIKQEVFPSGKPLILCTHQPINPALDDYLLKTIDSTKGKFQWWIRLHPRTSNREKEELMDLIGKWGLSKSIEFKKAASFPLPYLLKHTSIHISKYSGSIIEGILCNTPTIILDEIGINSFESHIDGVITHGLLNPTSSELIGLIDQLVGTNVSQKLAEIKQNDFKKILDELIRKNIK